MFIVVYETDGNKLLVNSNSINTLKELDNSFGEDSSLLHIGNSFHYITKESAEKIIKALQYKEQLVYGTE